MMLTSRRTFSSSAKSGKSGRTRTETLIFMAVLLILAGMAYGPISAYRETAKINRAVESARTISTLLSQYATDNNGVYPVGEGTPAIGKSEGIARSLLANNYTPDAAIFALGSTAPYSGKASDFSDLTAANVSWDFTAGTTTTAGITSSDPDLLPTVYSTGENVTYPTAAGTDLDLPLSGNGPFGTKGVIVAYKSNNAAFIKGTPSGTNVVCSGFISKEFKSTGTYTQIRP
jgi:type II secretory pathway pseudopilin PulG